MNRFVSRAIVLLITVVLSSQYQFLISARAATESNESTDTKPASAPHLEPDQDPNTSSSTAPPQLADSTPSQGVGGGANSVELPSQILRTHINLHTSRLSANSRQLAEIMEVTPILLRVQEGRAKLGPNYRVSSDNMVASQQLCVDTVDATQLIQQANLSIDYALAEINAEQNVYAAILSTYTSDRDKAVFKTNAMSFMTNGALWAIGEALDIPTNTHPNYSVSSGIFGILAGII